MKTGLARLIIGCVAFGASVVVMVVGGLSLRIMQAGYHAGREELFSIMSPATRVAIQETWAFPVLLVCFFIWGAYLLTRWPNKVVLITVTCVCFQGLVVWTAFLMLSFDQFVSGGGFHSKGNFAISKLVLFEHGVFPCTLLAILLPLWGALRNLKQPKLLRSKLAS